VDGIHQLRQFHRFGQVSFEADVEDYFNIIVHGVGAKIDSIARRRHRFGI